MSYLEKHSVDLLPCSTRFYQTNMLAVQPTFIGARHSAFIEFWQEGSHKRSFYWLEMAEKNFNGWKTKIMVYIMGVDVTSTLAYMIDHCSYRDTKRLSNPERRTNLNPWPLLHRCNPLPTELSSHLGVGHIMSSLYTRCGEECKWIYERSYICTAVINHAFMFFSGIRSSRHQEKVEVN